MGFDGKTPKPNAPVSKTTWHKHEYWSLKLNRWVEERCNCATGKYHKTPKN